MSDETKLRSRLESLILGRTAPAAAQAIIDDLHLTAKERVHVSSHDFPFSGCTITPSPTYSNPNGIEVTMPGGTDVTEEYEAWLRRQPTSIDIQGQM